MLRNTSGMTSSVRQDLPLEDKLGIELVLPRICSRQTHRETLQAWILRVITEHAFTFRILIR